MQLDDTGVRATKKVELEVVPTDVPMSEWFSKTSVELILNGFSVSRRRTCPASINIGRPIGLRKTIVALGRGGANNYAKHFEIDHDGHNFAAAARFHQLLVDRLIAPTLL
jgi:hypothetical protein